MKVYVTRSRPGGGKSTWIKQFIETYHGCEHLVEVFSADHFFESDGEYKFNPKLLGEAHGSCLRQFTRRMVAGDPTGEGLVAVVDNCNRTVWEIMPYIQVAVAFGHDVKVIHIHCLEATAAAKNVHGVPEHLILNWRPEQLPKPFRKMEKHIDNDYRTPFAVERL